MFTKQNLAVLSMASKDKSRYSITNVLVTQEGTIATDGHALGFVGNVKSELDVPFEPFQVSAETLKPVLASMNGGSCFSTSAGLHCNTKIGPVDVPLVQDASPFPNWKCIVDGMKAAAADISFDPALLIKALQMFGKDCKRVKFSIVDNESAMRIDDTSEEKDRESFAIVMPMRIK